ncbi:hypothetical protein QO190_05330 [Cloacibacterium sp. Arc13]|uniref:DUF6624 domain-containing protein n=1 Tax=Cloacibacterium TaxID=501783 RepID=UPI00352E9602
MKIRILLFFILFFVMQMLNSCKSNAISNHYNIELKNKLKNILYYDQIYREYFDTETTDKRKTEILQELNITKEKIDHNKWGIINDIDKENLKEVEKIIKIFGYPGKSLVGEPENTAVFYVIQHSNKISEYFDLIREAGKRKELPFKYVAMMIDRKLVSEGKSQIYGTQLFGKSIQCSGQEKFVIYVLPIKNHLNVNKRRKRAGFDTTVEQNAERFGIKYIPYTFENLEKIDFCEK